MPSSRLRPLVSVLLTLVLAAAALGAPAPQLALAKPATPAVYLVDRTDDVFATGCIVATPNDCSLRGAVQNANANPGSTIVLAAQQTYQLTDTPSGELVLTATTVISTSQALCITNCLAVVAGGPSWPYRLLEVKPGATVTVDAVEFTHGVDSNGGALENFGTLSLSGSQIFSNTAYGWGGGILNYGTLTLSNTVINGNKAATTGGAIANQADVARPGKMTIVNSNIITNSVTGPLAGQGSGGGITSFDNISGTIHPLVSIVNSNILSNTGTITGFGGGLYVDGVMTLTNVALQGNSAAGGGGAYVHFGTLNMQGGSVVSNTSLTSGGSGGGFRNDGLLTLDNVLLDKNVALSSGSGGAISSSTPFTVTNSTFTHNTGSSGGAIFLAGPSALALLSHVTMLANSATHGGAVAGYGAYTITNDSHLNGNTAFHGGALNIFGGGSALVTGNSQINNNQTANGAPGTSDGGGIYNTGRLQIQNASLDGNIASNGGAAAIYNGAGNTATLTGADLVGNQALDGPGGAVTNLGALTITASTLLSNTSLGGGGAISNTGMLVILNTTLGANASGGAGGALFNNGQAKLNFVTLADNSAAGDGGLITTGVLTLSNSLFSGNTGSGAPNCAGTVTSLGHNLIRDTTGCTLVGPGTGDKLNVDPKLTA